ncbi:Hypothetical predicted protein [Cloeon dipterum]|uniref:Translation initiation factor 3 N-terminal domain-containing protein n=1 Tax=Cloeon dipterum TaxID=197152 RepID=A0A8S1CP28_9INSE|nr:Hypothetical predicted protein [Cloeon dipterum]
MAAAGLSHARQLLLQTFVRTRGALASAGNAPKVTCGRTGPAALFSSERSQQGPDGKPPARPKTVPKPLVTLLGPEKGSMTVMLLEEAEKIAKRRSLQLEWVSNPDAKSNRATYRLLTASSGAGKLAAKVTKQDHKEKQLLLSSKIGTHDLESKIKQMVKWIKKRTDVRVTISGAESEAQEVFSTIEKGLISSEARFLQKRFKGGNLKFTVMAPKEVKKEADSSIEDIIKTAE